MSLLNVAVLPDRMFVATDSAASAGDGAPGHTSKLLPLPHVPAVLAGRGHVAVLGMALMLTAEQHVGLRL